MRRKYLEDCTMRETGSFRSKMCGVFQLVTLYRKHCVDDATTKWPWHDTRRERERETYSEGGEEREKVKKVRELLRQAHKRAGLKKDDVRLWFRAGLLYLSQELTHPRLRSTTRSRGNSRRSTLPPSPSPPSLPAQSVTTTSLGSTSRAS